MRTIEQISNADGDVILEWFKSVRRQPTADIALRLVEWCDKYANGVITLNNLNGAAKSYELRDVWKTVPKIPSPDNFNDVTAQWLKTLPQALLTNGRLSEDMGKRVMSVLETQFENHYSLENLDAALAVVKENMFPTAPASPAPAPKKIVRGTREDVLAQVGVKAETGRINHAHASEPTFTKAEMAKVYEVKEIEAKTWVDEHYLNPPGTTTASGRVDHGLVGLVRNSIRAIVQEEQQYKAQHPEDIATWGRIKNRVILFFTNDPDLPDSVSQNFNRSIR